MPIGRAIDPVVDAPSPEPSLRVGRRFEYALILGWWTVYGILLAAQRLVASTAEGNPYTILEAAARAFPGAAVWAVITVIAFSLSRNYPLDRPGRFGALALHVVASVIVSAGEILTTWLIGQTTGWLEPGPFSQLFFQVFPSDVVVYWLLVGVAHGLKFYRRYRERDLLAAQLTSRLAMTELHLLKSQLHPHFLFNTLHAISALMHRDVKAADRMLARLSELLRVSLDYTGTQEVSLQEELEFLEPYIEIEKTRLGDRLSVEIDINPQVLDARVPHMILQPLVENAVRHGIAPRASPGRITVTARGRRGMLDLEVRDNGRGLAPGRSANGGLGLANTRARLEHLYGEDFSFEPRNMPEGGFRVAITIPFRPNAPENDEPDQGPE